MAEFVEKRCEDMISELEQMERIKLFDRHEIQTIAKKLKEFEYKIERHTKTRKDYEEYIQYKIKLLALIKQRRLKYGITKKKSDIDYTVANKISNLYKDAMFKFKDISLWIDYIKFCKNVHFHSNISRILSRMLQIHGDKPKCWHIASSWELTENNNKQKARQMLLSGLHMHPNSQLLYIDAFKLELDDHTSTSKDTENVEDSEMSLLLKKAYIIYQQASECINDIKFTIKLLSITEEYDNTEELQKKIISDMVRDYTHEALMWDKIAHCVLEGLIQPDFTDTPIQLDNFEQTLLKDRIASCNSVYQTALEKIQTEEMWSLYIECLININKDPEPLPKFKRKLLKTALFQAHQARKLADKHYLHWINMLSTKANDENGQKQLYQLMCEATDTIPNSTILWHARMKYLLLSGQEEQAAAIYPKMTGKLGEKALPLWRMLILHQQTKNLERTEETFQAALQAHPLIAKDVKPDYIEWLALNKGIQAARKVYNELCVQPPFSLECHQKMVSLEIMQPEISLKHARQTHELATHLFGRNDKSVWMDFIKFEFKYGDPWEAGQIHNRAVKRLDKSLISSFIEEFVLMQAKATR